MEKVRRTNGAELKRSRKRKRSLEKGALVRSKNAPEKTFYQWGKPTPVQWGKTHRPPVGENPPKPPFHQWGKTHHYLDKYLAIYLRGASQQGTDSQHSHSQASRRGVPAASAPLCLFIATDGETARAKNEYPSFGRGEIPQVDGATAAAPQRKRGRPPKNAAGVICKSPDAVKAKRGRPLGSKNKPKIVTPVVTHGVIESLKAEISEAIELQRAHFPNDDELTLRYRAEQFRSQRYKEGRWPDFAAAEKAKPRPRPPLLVPPNISCRRQRL